MKLFGFEIKRSEEDIENNLESFAAPTNDEGALNVGAAGGSYGMLLDLEGTSKTEAELINRYRSMLINPEIQQAVDEIVNEAICIDSLNETINIDLSRTTLSAKIKKEIGEEFKQVLKLLDFSNNGYDIFQRFYVDGRINYHLIVDPENAKEGIKELRFLDPRKIRLIREIVDTPIPSQPTGITIKKVRKEYYMYSENAFGTAASTLNNMGISTNNSGLRIAKDSIIRVTSGVMNESNIILSHLHKAIKSLNQLRMLEDATVIYTLTRAPERRIFYVDVGNLPKAKAEQYLHDMMARHKNKVTYDPSTGEVKDDRKMMCYAMDTKIPLLDGRVLELQEIIREHENGKQNWVYSCDPITGKFYPGPVSWAGITKQNSEVVKITFDNGKTVTCTPDHKFPVWGRGFIEAQHLTTEDSIIPGYRRTKELLPGGLKYEQIYKNETGTWEFTHREVSAWKKENNIEETFVYNQNTKDKPKTIIHHKNFNNIDNSPHNLVLMDYKDHLKYHSEIQSIIYTDEILDTVNEAYSNFTTISNVLNTINNSVDIDAWKAINQIRHVKQRDISTLLFTKHDFIRALKLLGHVSTNSLFVKGSNELNEYISKEHVGKVSFCKSWKIKTPDGNIEIVENLNRYCKTIGGLNRSNIKGKFGSKGYFAESLKNHKILSVEKLDEKITVGSMSIDNNETYHSHHTYLIDAGVYTKNTMTEDYWFPRREGNRSTEVDTLAAGAGLGEERNLPYFQNKLYKALNVPVSRLLPENTYSFGRTSEITREEIKFAKFIQRLRVKFSIIFDKILEKQLILKGIMSPDEWVEIKNSIGYEFSKDNYFAELKEMEILKEKLSALNDVDAQVGKYFSKQWIIRNVLFMTDEQALEMQEQMDKELLIQQNLDRQSQQMDSQENPDAQQEVDTAVPPEQVRESFINIKQNHKLRKLSNV